jgi:transposase
MTVYLGIDWSEQKHVVCVMNAAGAVIQGLTIGHTLEGMFKLDEAIRALGVSKQEVQIGLETAHSLLIDFLLDRGYSQVYILPPGQVHANQNRYAQSKAKDDWRDAWVQADMLRTDRGRYRPWRPDLPVTRQIQVQVRYVLYLSRQIRRQTNRLRAVLLRAYPAAVELFSKLDSPIALAFLQAYPTPQHAQRLSAEGFQAFLRAQRYPQIKHWSRLFVHLHGSYPEAQAETMHLYQEQIPQLAEQLELFVRQKRQALVRLQALFEQHPDAALYRSLPGAGEFLAPALLAEMGDDRERFPSAQVVQAIAGTCPINKSSGKHRVNVFRRACDRQFRYIATLWAGASIKQSGWAKTYFEQARKNGHSHVDATRRLANRWLVILWKLWQTRLPYQESVHIQNLLERAKPKLRV